MGRTSSGAMVAVIAAAQSVGRCNSVAEGARKITKISGNAFALLRLTRRNRLRAERLQQPFPQVAVVL